MVKGFTKVAGEDDERVLDAVHALLRAVPDLEPRLSDDLGCVAWDPATRTYSLEPGDPQELLESDGEWEPALRVPPGTLPEKVTAALAELARGPAPKALATLRAPANVGKLLTIAADRESPDAAAAAAALGYVDDATLVRVGFSKWKALEWDARYAFEEAARALATSGEISTLGPDFLATWAKVKGVHGPGDFLGKIRLAAGVARNPEVHTRLVEDLRDARGSPEEDECRRAEAAAMLLAESGTREAAVALVEEAIWQRGRRMSNDYHHHVLQGVRKALGALPAARHGDWPLPYATLRLALGKLSHDVHKHVPQALLVGLAQADPERTVPLLRMLQDKDTFSEPGIYAAEAIPGEAGVALLREWLRADREEHRSQAAQALVRRLGVAGLPAWLSVQRASDSPRYAPYWSPGTFPPGMQATFPRDLAGWEAWLAERGLPPGESPPPLSDEDQLGLCRSFRPWFGTGAAWRQELTDRLNRRKDPTLTQALIVTAELGKRASWDPEPVRWADPEGLGFAELATMNFAGRLAWLAAADLPPQRMPGVLALLEEPLTESVPAWRDEVVPTSKAATAALEEEERSWLAAVG